MLAAAQVLAQVTRIEVEVRPREVEVGQTFSVFITVRGARGARIQPDWPEGLEELHVAQQSNVQWINGKMSAAVTYQYSMRAVAAGQFTVPSFEVDGRRSKPVSITVRPAREESAEEAAQRRQGQYFAELLLSDDEVWVGEPVAFGVRSYVVSSHVFTDAGPVRSLDFDGFRVDLVDEGRASMREGVKVGGKAYTELVTERRILVPHEPGERQMMPVELVVEVEPRTSRRPRGFFLMRSDSQRLRMQAPMRRLKVKALPTQGRPADFAGLVGRDLVARTKLTAERPRVGDSMVLEVVLEGRADLRGIKELDLDLPPELTLFETRRDASIEWDADGPRGRLTFEVVLVPTSPGPLKIPDLDLAWFDAAAGRYTRLRAEGPTVEVQGSVLPTPGGAALPPISSRALAPSEEAPQTIRFLREDPGRLQPRRPPPHRRGLVQALLFAWGLLLVAVELLARHRARFAGDDLGLRAFRAFDHARRDLDALRDAQDREAWGRLSAILRELVAARARRPAASLTRDEFSDLLQQQSQDPGCVQEGLALLDQAERGRYATGAGGDLQDLVRRARTWVDELKRGAA